MVNTSCAVLRCGSTSHRSRGLKFHQFPRDERSYLWIQACKRPDLLDKDVEQLKHIHVCSLHFEQRMYGKMLLKKSAIPTLNLPLISTMDISTQTDSIEPASLQISTSQGVQTDELYPRKRTKSTPEIGPMLVQTDSLCPQKGAGTQGQDIGPMLVQADGLCPCKRAKNKGHDIGSTLVQTDGLCPRKRAKTEPDVGSTLENFLELCDVFLPYNLSVVVKSHIAVGKDF